MEIKIQPMRYIKRVVEVNANSHHGKGTHQLQAYVSRAPSLASSEHLGPHSAKLPTEHASAPLMKVSQVT